MVGSLYRRKKKENECWSMRTLVESDGNIATGVSREGGAVGRKDSLMVAKLSKFETSVVTIIETKWFGSAL